MTIIERTIRLVDPPIVRRLADPSELEPRSIGTLARAATAAGFDVLVLETVVAAVQVDDDVRDLLLELPRSPEREVMVLGIHDERGWFRAYWRAVTPRDGGPSPAALKPDLAVLRTNARLPRPVGVTELAAWIKAAP